jgi:hypothetical protein
VNPVDVNRLVEQAKADASATRASKALIKKADAEAHDTDPVNTLLSTPDSEVERLSQELMDLAEQEASEEATKNQAEVERGRHIKMAKVLAAIDVLAGVQ